MSRKPSAPNHGSTGTAPERATPEASSGSKQPSKSAAGAHKKSKRRDTADRRNEILQAAFNLFAEHGFAQTRLEDVAKHAGIAKGTIYLYFSDKETLFEELLREAAQPVLAVMEAVASLPDLPVQVILRRMHMIFVDQILLTHRKYLIRLLIQEGPRFPAITEFYYRDIVRNALELISRIGQRGFESGELTSNALARFPQLVMAPLLTGVIWDALFEDQQHLDMEGMLSTYRELLISAPKPTNPTCEETGGAS
ncbi:TetR/AcrR family transcriptional regulator [Breoghania sp.]|uniref:TetR/AcrR family transcriptional regulator n=1 Tax=Breoghania sp. TaxID=2065378 RepID=UPI00260D6D95|nr:TetR/AcrR family transcriptional regulator [Breoghania sp.]MDJ0932734.1 TetR/AcrR family transcriptional regulator [Breoghania sp.]